MAPKKYVKQMSALEFERQFPNEDSCREYLRRKLWSKPFVCSRCEHQAFSFIKTRCKRECLQCGYQESLTANTIFHKTRTPLRKWFGMIRILATYKKPPSILQLQKELEIRSYETARTMSHRIRATMAGESQKDQLVGLVELDDAYYGGAVSGGKRGRGADGKKAVTVAVSKEKRAKGKGERPLKIAFQVTDKINAEAIDKLSQRQIAKGARVVTDGLTANITAMHKRKGEIEHERIVLNGDKEKIRTHFKWVHIVISNSKRLLLGIHHHVAPKNLVGFLGEFAWRFDRRHCPNVFGQLMGDCLKKSPITAKDIRGHLGLSALTG